jgi:hypothetical protein
MLSGKIEELFVNEKRPETQQDFERELDMARSKGYKIPAIDMSTIVVTQAQAGIALEKLKIDPESDFYHVMKEFRGFPLGRGAELYTLQQIVDAVKTAYWDDDFPGFSDKFLELSSIEGEASYFYDRKTGNVFIVSWNEMTDFFTGKIKPQWQNYSIFLDWYYR